MINGNTISLAEELNTNIPTLSSNDWILGNIHQYGYYRVNYDNRNWEALIRQLQKDHQVTLNSLSLCDWFAVCWLYEHLFLCLPKICWSHSF